jgi:hypothetical protein
MTSTQVRIGAFLLLSSPTHTTALSFGHFPDYCYDALATCISSGAPAVVSLSCRWLWLSGSSLATLIQALPSMEQLQQLHVPHIATDQLIAAVGRSCHRLQLLDLTGAIGLTEAGIKVEKDLILIDSKPCPRFACF